MRVFYLHSDATATVLLDQHAAAIAGARILNDRSDDRAGRDALLELLRDGDELLVSTLEHLGDTAEAALATLRCAVRSGARVTLLQEGLDGALLMRAADLLDTLPKSGDARGGPFTARRPRGRATPGKVAEILALSSARVPIRAISLAVGLSEGTVNRIRRAHRASWTADCMGDCMGSAD